MPGPRRRISLCLIVRDEAALLGACLASAAAAVDEIIVVDTGSRDETVAIAEAAGARIHRFDWVDDFAAARNASLEAATGDFILVLDADERLAPGAATHLRALVQAEAEHAPPTLYLARIENLDAQGHSLGSAHMARLWRRRPSLRFSGRVHERVGEGVAGLRRAFEDALHILHLGYDPALRAARGKAARNRALLRAELAERPEDPSLHFYLAREDYAAGQDAAALAGFKRVIEDGTVLNFSLSAHLFGAECLRALGRHQEALALALRGLGRAPDYGELWFAAGQAALSLGRPRQAEAQLRRAARVPTGVAATAFRDPSVARWRHRLSLARCLVGLGRGAEALAEYEAALAAMPEADRPTTVVELCGVLIDEGAEDRAWAALEPLFESQPQLTVPPVLRLMLLYIEVKGLKEAAIFATDCLTHYPGLLEQIPLVGAAAEICDALGDEDLLHEWLRVCVRLHSPHPEHYERLAQILDGRGEPLASALHRATALRLRAQEA